MPDARRPRATGPDATPAGPSPIVQQDTVPEATAGALIQTPFVIDERYVVERELGRGGMGRVYLARDRRLKRRVALKLLSSRSSQAADLRKLEHEARLLGALGHPNIVDVHDIGSFDGQPFIVEEYLEGVTLRARLGEGRLPLAQALQIAAQIARGLAAAHEKGVVHCDLKPENLLLLPDERLKILDFGVARLTAPAPAATTLEEGESAGSGPTAFAGTPAYSSPEQLLGRSVDQRSDIFSFGAVLYEMLSGKRAFVGASAVEVGFAVLHAAPPPLPESVPSGIRRIVARCLEKDPSARFQSARDLAFDIEALARETLRKRWSWRLVGLLAAVACGIATALLIGRGRHGAMPSFRQITFFPGAVWGARFAPDGREVSYTEAFDGKRPRIYSTRIGSPQYHRLEAENAALLALSPRGDLAMVRDPKFGFFHFSGTLSVLPPAGGAPREMVELADYADWGPDGSLAVVRRAGAQQRLEYPIDNVLFATSGWLSDPRISPDGQSVAFLHHPELTDDHGSLLIARRSGGVTELAGWSSAARGLAWSPNGSEIWVTASVWSQQAPMALRAVTLGGAQRILWQTSDDLELEDVSRAGAALLTSPQRYMGIGAYDGKTERDLSIRDEQVLYDLSPDGSMVLFSISPRTPERDALLFIRRIDGSPPVQLAAGLGGAFSPDGRTAFVFSALAGKPPSLVPIGPGEPRVLDSVHLAVTWAQFFPDGRRVLLAAREKEKATRLYVLSLQDGTLRALSGEGVDAVHGAVSRDGSVVAAVDSQTRVALYPVDGGPAAEVPEAAAGEVPFGWTADGALLVGRTLEVPLEIYRIDLKTHRRAPWKTVRPAEPGAFGISRVFAVGEALAYSHLSWKTHLYVVEGLQ